MIKEKVSKEKLSIKNRIVDYIIESRWFMVPFTVGWLIPRAQWLPIVFLSVWIVLDMVYRMRKIKSLSY